MFFIVLFLICFWNFVGSIFPFWAVDALCSLYFLFFFILFEDCLFFDFCSFISFLFFVFSFDPSLSFSILFFFFFYNIYYFSPYYLEYFVILIVVLTPRVAFNVIVFIWLCYFIDFLFALFFLIVVVQFYFLYYLIYWLYSCGYYL